MDVIQLCLIFMVFLEQAPSRIGSSDDRRILKELEKQAWPHVGT